MSVNESTAPKQDVYARVTSQIITAIESGVGQYRMPWAVRQDKGFSPISVGSAKPYRGVNTLALWAQAQIKGYSSAFWGTYQQWKELGGQVRKGERGSSVVYWGSYEKQTDDDAEQGSHRTLFAKGYTVFNIEQVDGCKLPKRFEPKLSRNERITHAEQFFAGTGIQIRDGGNRAFYRPDIPEAVYLPGFDQFPDRVDYYSVLAHEATHNADSRIMPRRMWDTHESRSHPTRLIGII